MPQAGPSRRRVLLALGLAPAALAGCGLLGPAREGPDPLVALADAARADAALAGALVAAEPELAERVVPLVDARTAHAAALDAEVRRLDPDAAPATPAAPPPAAGAPTLARLRAAVEASAAAAGEVALGADAARVGLVAAVSACCATYAAVLG